MRCTGSKILLATACVLSLCTAKTGAAKETDKTKEETTETDSKESFKGARASVDSEKTRKLRDALKKSVEEDMAEEEKQKKDAGKKAEKEKKDAEKKAKKEKEETEKKAKNEKKETEKKAKKEKEETEKKAKKEKKDAEKKAEKEKKDAEKKDKEDRKAAEKEQKEKEKKKKKTDEEQSKSPEAICNELSLLIGNILAKEELISKKGLSKEQLNANKKEQKEIGQKVCKLIKDAIDQDVYTKDDFGWLVETISDDPKCKDDEENTKTVLTVLAETKGGKLKGEAKENYKTALVDLAKDKVSGKFALEIKEKAD
ncbi:hypothetical protein FACS189472_04960 [Alphaproteobacteria bacterium]|nr:hypothetical protein FACS189472_04960 [Alphaproteobacteria bacterium]